MTRKLGILAATFSLGGCIALGAAAIRVARAEDRPPVMPTRDVAVDYHTTANGRTNDLRVLYSATTQRLRAEAAGQSSYVIIDGRAKQLHVVMDRQKAVMDLPFDADRMRGFLLSDKAHYTRTGHDTVAGLPCTVWNVRAEHSDATACITDDGVILRGEGAGSAPTGQSGTGKIEAVSVHYGPQPDDVFTIPAGYRAMARPELPGRTGTN
jgi:hypothetical protein